MAISPRLKISFFIASKFAWNSLNKKSEKFSFWKSAS